MKTLCVLLGGLILACGCGLGIAVRIVWESRQEASAWQKACEIALTLRAADGEVQIADRPLVVAVDGDRAFVVFLISSTYEGSDETWDAIVYLSLWRGEFGHWEKNIEICGLHDEFVPVRIRVKNL